MCLFFFWGGDTCSLQIPPTKSGCAPFFRLTWRVCQFSGDLFITHCWVEGVYEFLDKVLASWPLMAKAAYICFLSNPQNLDIGELIASPEESPFAKALHVAHHILVVPNRSASIYSRIWCVYEAGLKPSKCPLQLSPLPSKRNRPDVV